ncbi:MAG: class I tRNA ligase family protein [Candidatus Peribacteraceae bacterium]|nr:class I tRNA ligase family protein [Candidatus Peribacteraceae bacterium]
MFDPVDPKQSFPDLERGILQYWKEEDLFKRSIQNRTKPDSDPLDMHAEAAEESFGFYDGPPFATGLPHYGHLLAGTIKDVIPRYQTMRGKRVQRRFGWDCHGLPVEYEIEKEHNIGSKREIEEMGVATFNGLCRAAVQRYTKEWRTAVERMGRWVDMDWDYRTMDPDYMESIWWVFKQLHEKGLIYEGHKPMHICPRCVTPLSNFEVTQGYKDITDLSVTVKFELEETKEAEESKEANEGKTYVLAWTTTPWTLPGNLLLAVGPDIRYARVKSEGASYIVASALVEKVFGKREHVVEKELAGKELVGKRYRPLFPYFADKYKEKAFRIIAADFVATEEGTGVVHVAPGFGEDDFNAGKREGVPVLQHVTMTGEFTKDVTDFAGEEVKPKNDPMKTDRKVTEWLEKHGSLFVKETYKHSYPHCWRCDAPLLNYATSSWFVSVEKIKEDMLQANAETAWVPAHLRDGRFGKWLEGARDWAISRNRYWGTPLPIWKCEETGQIEVLGSREDLFRKCPDRFTRVTVLRHGESEGNLLPVYQGVTPGTDLTARGKKQAKRAGAFLQEQDVAMIYASPLARTEQTAKASAKATRAPLAIDERLREVNFGDYEGKHIDFSNLSFVKARRLHKFENNKVESIYHFPGMETWNDVAARTDAFLKDILPRHRGQHIVVVTHADPLLAIKHFFTKEDPNKLTHQPYPTYADPVTFYWDHQTNNAMDLHKETVDGLTWNAIADDGAVQVTLARHGETDWNRDGKLQGGGVDNPLNETGRKQASALAASLHKGSFDAIISSDLSRAVETAEILSEKLGIPVAGKWESLRERAVGDWEGKPRDEVRHSLGIPSSASLSFMHQDPPNGETFAAFLQRTEEAARRLRREFPGKRVLLVGHGGTICALRMMTERLPFEQASELSKNGGTFEITLRPAFTRIPDVLDCWFESGAMPYAQSHYPFEMEFTEKKRKNLPPGFPADFIAEGLDQTRGWFYTLTVLSSALFKRPAFLNCVVNGIVLAEDGKKMSKRLKNYPEPLAVTEKHGADALRFALMSSPAVRGEDLRFSEKTVEEALRNVLLPLWNTYAFFVTYANAVHWEPSPTRAHSPHPLDRWIRAETQDLANRMTEQLEAYDLSATCAELHDTVDALTNWYVRLSRRRFAGKGGIHDATEGAGTEQDRNDALSTLYDVLLTVSQLLAPFCPFITETVYRNLVAEEHGSVHLTDWPATRELTKAEETLLRKTRLLRAIVSLGLKVRAERKIKTRQPLAKAIVAVPAALKVESLSAEEIRLLQEELNVKEVEMVDDPGALADSIAQVDARKVGPRLGARVQELIAAGKRGEFTVAPDGTVLILDERLAADEATVVYRGKEGRDVAADKGIVVSLDTAVSPELELEGCGRDLIRAIQKERKDAGLSVADRIKLAIEGADDVLQVCGAQIEKETNAVLEKQAGGEPRQAELNGRPVTFRFEKL